LIVTNFKWLQISNVKFSKQASSKYRSLGNGRVVIYMNIVLQNPNIHHPKTIALGLTHEKIVGISACSVRASVFTESDKVATWVDDTLNVVASKLEHGAQTFQEFLTDKITSLHTCSLYTCARLESGALYWWYVVFVELDHFRNTSCACKTIDA